MNSGQNKNFFKILKKSVAKNVRLFDTVSISNGSKKGRNIQEKNNSTKQKHNRKADGV